MSENETSAKSPSYTPDFQSARQLISPTSDASQHAATTPPTSRSEISAIQTTSHSNIDNTLESHLPKLTFIEDDEKSSLRQQIQELQRGKYEMEMELRRKVDELTLLASKVKQLQEAVQQGKLNTVKMIEMFEEEAKVANRRIAELSQELVKSQELTKKFETALEKHLQHDEAMRIQRENNQAFMSGTEKHHYQTLSSENVELRREIARLSSVNGELMRRVKKVEDENAQVLNKYFVAQATLDEVNKNLKHTSRKKKELDETLTKNTAEWLAKKREMRNLEEEMRWNIIHDTTVGYRTTFGQSTRRTQRTSPPGHASTLHNQNLPSVKQIYMPKRIITARPATSMPRS